MCGSGVLTMQSSTRFLDLRKRPDSLSLILQYFPVNTFPMNFLSSMSLDFVAVAHFGHNLEIDFGLQSLINCLEYCELFYIILFFGYLTLH